MTNSKAQLEWTNRLQSSGGIHQVHDDSVPAILEAAKVQNLATFRVSLADVVDDSDLLRRFAIEFLFPYEPRNLDVLLDLLSDLEWLVHDEGYVIVLEGLEGIWRHNPQLVREILGLLPNLTSRWLAGRVPFHVVVVGDGTIGSTLEHEVDSWNQLVRDRQADGILPTLREVELHKS